MSHRALSPQQFPVAALLPHTHDYAEPDYVEKYAERMKNGEWDWHGSSEPITFHQKEQVLEDGTHRVLAAHQAGITHVPVVVR